MFGIGAQELLLIMVVALLVFGPKRLPELARSLGKGLAEFRRASTDLRNSLSADPPTSSTIHPPSGPAQAISPESEASPPKVSESPSPAAAPAQTVEPSTTAALEPDAEPGGGESGPRGG